MPLPTKETMPLLLKAIERYLKDGDQRSEVITMTMIAKEQGWFSAGKRAIDAPSVARRSQ